MSLCILFEVIISSEAEHLKLNILMYIDFWSKYIAGVAKKVQNDRLLVKLTACISPALSSLLP